MMRKIGVLTSGGDAPGMNAAVMSIARSAAAYGMPLIGIKHGYNGLLRKSTSIKDDLQHHRHASREKRIRHGGKRACRIKTVIAVRALQGRAVRRFLVRHQPDRTAVGTTCYVSHSQTRERKRPRKKLSGFLIRTALKSSRVFRQDKSTRSFLYKG